MYSIPPYIINKYPQCRVLKLDMPEGISFFPSEIRTNCADLAAEKAACAVGFCHPSAPQASLLFPSKLGSLLEDGTLSYKPCFGCIFSPQSTFLQLTQSCKARLVCTGLLR